MKFYDLGLDDPGVGEALDAAFRRVRASGRLILGEETAAFEAEFAAYCDSVHAVGVGNGLDALSLALRAAGIGPGDEVIVPAHTFVATWLAVTAVGARPVPAEVDARTYTLDPAAALAAVTALTAAIIPVSLYGHPCDMDAIMTLADRHNLFVLEDAAQAHGARYRGRRVGSIAHATAFSFYPTKNLGALGDGGAVVTGDAAIAARVGALRNYGSEQKYVHRTEGVNSRLDELQAAFLRTKLPRLDAENQRRHALAAAYGQALATVDAIAAPADADWAEPVHHLYVVRTQDRDALRARLLAADIETLIHYPTPCHLQPAFADLGLRAGAFPQSERLAAEVLSLPFWPGLSLDAPAQVAAAIRA